MTFDRRRRPGTRRTARRIFAAIEATPGAYLRELQRDLALPMGMLEYHLARLERAGLVTVLSGENKRFFPERMDARDKRYLVLLRQDGCRRVVLRLLAAPDASQSSLQEARPYRPSTLRHYLGKLVYAGLAVRAKDGRQNTFRLVDGERAYALLVRHQPSFLDRVLDGFLEGFDVLHLAEVEETSAEEE